jgi:formate hydrogenlyase subunit 3/multisubunit Na+/H+ antiporter MnhD subunit
MITGPALLLAMLLLGAALVYVLRRMEAVAAFSAAALAGLVALGLWKLPTAMPVRLAGRTVWLGRPLVWGDLSLVLTPAAQALLVYLLLTGAFAFILGWRTYQGRTFYPFGLVLLACWATVALLQPLLLAPFVIVLSSIVAVFLIQAGRPGNTRGAWYQLLFPSLAVPFFLIAAWYINLAPLNPDEAMPYRIAGWLLVIGFIFLLQPAPLHVAVPAIAGHAPPVVAAFLWVGGQSVTLFLLQRFLVTYPWMATTIDSARWLLWLGILTALVGGLLAAAQNRLGRLMGYAGLFDYGVLLVAMALRGTAGLPTAVWLLLTRTIALMTFALGAAALRHYMEDDHFDRLAGAVSRLPWAVAALLAGGLALVGLPLTAQFASRWALLQLLAENDTRWVLLILLGGCGVLIGVIRAGKACFGSLSESKVERESLGLTVFAAILVVSSVLLGIFPQVLTDPVAAVILPLSVLGP